MKAIIFDLDNTLIMWKDEFLWALRKVLKDLNYNLSDEEINKIDSLINNHENHYDKLSKENFLEYLNSNLDFKLPASFVEKLIIEQENLYYEDKELEDVLSYLSKKYDLYILTNWFTTTQIKRLENMHILKYFKKVIGADINYYKPDIRVYNIILDKYKPEDCISIGDSLKNDIEVPSALGMKVIWKTDEKSDKYPTIKELKELQNIL